MSSVNRQKYEKIKSAAEQWYNTSKEYESIIQKLEDTNIELEKLSDKMILENKYTKDQLKNKYDNNKKLEEDNKYLKDQINILTQKLNISKENSNKLPDNETVEELEIEIKILKKNIKNHKQELYTINEKNKENIFSITHKSMLKDNKIQQLDENLNNLKSDYKELKEDYREYKRWERENRK